METESKPNRFPTIHIQALIVDGMVLIQQLSGKRTDISRCSDLAIQFIQSLGKKTNSYDCVNVVFDQYHGEVSLMSERCKNAKTTGSMSTPIRTNMSVFLSNNKTKASLTEYLSSKLLEHYKVGQKPLIVSIANGAKSNHVNVEHLTSTQEEADTMIILHAVHAQTLMFSFSP